MSHQTRITEGASGDVPLAFDDGAARYDFMVALNPGYHRHLRTAARALVDWLPGRAPAPVRIADLGCGSGASTAAILRATNGRRDVTDLAGVDASTTMLAAAGAKTWPRGVRFVHGDAENVAAGRDKWDLTEQVDGVFAAYLFRNLSHRDEALEDVYDLLVPGGVLVVQEYSVAGSRAARSIWTAVCWSVVIPLGFLTSGRTGLYRYLWRSVLRFDTVEVFARRLRDAGFVDVQVRTMPGWQRGILHTFRARRP